MQTRTPIATIFTLVSLALLVMGCTKKPSFEEHSQAHSDSEKPIWEVGPTNAEGTTSFAYHGGVKYFQPDDNIIVYSTLDARPIRTDPGRFGVHIVQHVTGEGKKRAAGSPTLRYFVKTASEDGFKIYTEEQFVAGEKMALPFKTHEEGGRFYDYYFSGDNVVSEALIQTFRDLAQAPEPTFTLYRGDISESVALAPKTQKALKTMLGIWDHLMTLPPSKTAAQ